MRGTELGTERLHLRTWRDDDLEPFAALNADPVVMAHFVAPMTGEQSDELVRERIRRHLDEHGYGLWAVEVIGGDPFIGFVGLTWQTFPAHFTPALEVGWRLRRSAWGHGFATEAGRAAIDFAFDTAGVDEVVSMTSPENCRSVAVMRRLGMTHDPADDFEHPRVPEGHRLRRHVLYRITPQGRTW